MSAIEDGLALHKKFEDAFSKHSYVADWDVIRDRYMQSCLCGWSSVEILTENYESHMADVTMAVIATIRDNGATNYATVCPDCDGTTYVLVIMDTDSRVQPCETCHRTGWVLSSL